MDSYPILPDGEHFCRTDLVSLPIGGGQYLAYSKLDKSSHVLPAVLADLLNVCGTFKPLSEHAQACYDFLSAVTQQPDDSREQFIIRSLEEFMSAGLLVPESMLRQSFRQRGDVQPGPRITSVGVVTNNRVAGLKRCLVSYMENDRGHGRGSEFVVMDDSREPEVREAALLMLQSLQKHYGVRVSYAGPAEKRSFADALVKESGLPRDAVDFALFDTEQCGHPIGANRNALLLHTVGELAFSTDDDVVCEVAPAPSQKEGLAFESRGDFTKFWFFPDRQAALSAARRVGEDILSIHERLLGRSLAGCVAEYDHGGLSFEQVNAQTLHHLAAQRGRVPVTFNGVFGDSAMESPAMLLSLKLDSRQRLLQSKSTYLSALTSREVFRTVDRACVTDNPSCVTTTFGFDNSKFLPPFMPVLRSEDDIFGFTLRACVEDGYFGYLPWAVLHSPVEARAYSKNFLKESAASVRMYNVILACLTSFQLWREVTDEGQRLLRFGKHLVEIAAAPQRDFEEFVRVQMWRARSESIGYLEGYMHYFRRAPDFWADDVQYYIHNLRTALTADDFIVPQDLLSGRGAEEARKVSQRLVLKFGQLLCHWPELVEAARTLRAKGLRLARPL